MPTVLILINNAHVRADFKIILIIRAADLCVITYSAVSNEIQLRMP